jgi:capsular polysaccharide biosynthesis protein
MGALGSVIQEFSGVASMAGLDVGENGNPEALAILKSREFNERFITANNMMPILFRKYWDDTRNDWKPNLRRVPTLWDGFDYFTKKVRTLTEDRKSGLLTINVDWRDRDLASKWANLIIAQLNEEMRQRAINEASGMVTYLTKEMERSDNLALRESVSRLIESEIKQRALATVRIDYAYRVVDVAEPADKRHPIRPLARIYLVFGALGGLIFGIGIALVRRPLERVRAVLREGQ